MTTIAERNERLVLERLIESDDRHGGQERQWTAVARPWCKVRMIAGKEALIAHTMQEVRYYRIETRLIAMMPADRLMRGAEVLNIRSAEDPDGRRRDLVVMADTLVTG